MRASRSLLQLNLPAPLPEPGMEETLTLKVAAPEARLAASAHSVQGRHHVARFLGVPGIQLLMFLPMSSQHLLDKV